MKMLVRFVVVAAVSALLPLPLRAQTMLGPNPNIGGIPMVCKGAMTLVYPHGALGDIARASPGRIMLDQAFFSLPPFVQRFVWGHECGHIVGMNEIGADCLAVKFGKQQGWLSYQGLQQVKVSLVNTAGSWTHLPGPHRIQLLEQCWKNS